MGRLDGKVALISGAARGQGAAEARLFVAEGARVVLGDVLDEDGRLLAKELGEAATYVHHDVTSPEGWAAAVGEAVERFGALDVLVNNAGIFRLTPLATATAEEYLEVVRVNQLGTFLGMQAVIPAMSGRGGASIVNVSSVAGLRGSGATAAYTASKFAVRGMTKVAALELAGAGIRVNSVHPGFIDTPMLRDLLVPDTTDAKAAMGSRVPIGTIASADDVARMVLFLASDDSAHCTGAEFVVDGGLTAGLHLNG